jgi:hypothetical protein
VGAAVQTADTARIRELLADATKQERAALFKVMEPLLQQQVPRSERIRWGTVGDNPGFVAVMAGCADGSRAVLRALEGGPYRLHWCLTPGDYDAFAGILADRKPSWLPALVSQMLDRRHDGGVKAWPLARRLVRIGAIDRPDLDAYAVKMVRELAHESTPASAAYMRTEEESRRLGADAEQLTALVLDDPDLLNDEIWRLFTVPGVGSQMKHRVYGDFLLPGTQWAETLIRLVALGKLDRGRLLDACLDAFLRDFPPNHVTWYAMVHDQLAPTVEEKAKRSERYLALLAALGAPGLTVGQRGCSELLDAGLLDPIAFLAASSAPLARPQKSAATAQLKLISKITARHKAVRDTALATAALAFGHPREDVQAAALKLIATYGLPADAAARATVIEMAALVSPVVQPDAEALGLKPGQVPALAPDQDVVGDIPLAPLAQRVVPVTDPAELIQLLARLRENASDPVEVERALDGLVRLSVLPLLDRARHAAPLLKDERGTFGIFNGYFASGDMVCLARTWATGEMPEIQGAGYSVVSNHTRHTATPESMLGILSARMWEVCALIADGHGYPLLATPEFADGSISHDELLARLAKWPTKGPRPPRNDTEVAMLRLAPGAETILPDDLLAAYAPAQVPLSVEPGFASQNGGYVAVFGQYTEPDHVLAMERSRCCGHLVTYLRPGSFFSNHARADQGYDRSHAVAAWPLLAPHRPELITAHLLSAMSAGLNPGRDAAATAVRTLSGLGGAFGLIGHVALATGLAGVEADTRIAAADAWGDLARQRRLDPSLAAEAIVLGVDTGVFKLTRVADSLRYAAQDPDMAATVASACVAAAAALLTKPEKPTGLHLLLEIAAQAGAVSEVPLLPDPITDLACGKAKTKLAEAARRLAALA